jgi:hypothetical protein
MHGVARWSFVGGEEEIFVNIEGDTNTHMLKNVYIFIAILHWHLVMV